MLLIAVSLAGCGMSREPRAASVASSAGSAKGPGFTSRTSRPWGDQLVEHLARFPLAEAVDVYKFTHQSVFGPAHAVPSTEEARRYLDAELARLATGPADEPIVDRLGDDPPLVRLNLRPYIASGGDIDALVEAFAATATVVTGGSQEMALRLEVGVSTLRALGREADAAALAALAVAQADAGYPAAHHSAAYRAAYAPAYRVVSSALLAPEPASRPCTPSAPPAPER